MHQPCFGFSRYAALAAVLFGSVIGCKPAPSTSSSSGSGAGSSGSSSNGGSSGSTSHGGSNGGNSDTSKPGGGSSSSSSLSGGSVAGGTPAGGSSSSGTNSGGAGNPGGGSSSNAGAQAGSSGTSVGGSSSSSGTSPSKTACTEAPPADPKMPGYPDHEKFFSQAKATVLNLSLAEKAQQMRGTDPGSSSSRNWSDIFRQPDNTSKSIKGFTFRDGPRGVNLDAPIQATGTVHGKSTVFPVPMARGAAWDADLEYKIGLAIGDEMVAASQTMMLAPTINILRHPLWGRAQETYGEDPFQLGRLGTALVAGIQNYVPTCAKHFAANNIEKQRASKNAAMDEQTLREIYSRHFEMVIRDGGVACIMAAYNPVGGTNSTQNSKLLNDVLRKDFEFTGFVMSDWWAMPGGSSGTPNSATAKEAIAAGMDMELPWNFHYSTIESASIPQAQIDAAATRILEQKYRFGVDKGTGKKSSLSTFSGGSIAKNSDHIELARKAAVESMVLLENKDNTLPIKGASKIVVLGAKLDYWAPTDASGNPTGPGINNRADDVPNNGTIDFVNGVRVGDVGSSRVAYDASQAVSPCSGIKAAAGSATVTCSNSASDAKGADLVVVIAGLTPFDEGEEYNGSGDRSTFALDGKLNSSGNNKDLQNNLINDAVKNASGKPVVVVLEGGSVIDMPWLSSVKAVVMAWYPGMAGGTALGQLLFGQANFSGKLPISWHTDLKDMPAFDGGATTTMDYYVGYRHFDKNSKTPQYPLGYGLSYTKYDYSNLVVPCSSVTQTSVINVTVDVTNSGTVTGDEVVFLFVSYPDSTKKHPIKELKGFARVSLDAGAKKTVQIPVRGADLKYWDNTCTANDRTCWKWESSVKIMVGPSSTSLPLSDTVTVK